MINSSDKIILFSFLKDNNAFWQYVRNMQKLSKQSSKEFFENTNLNEAIVGAFVWSQTPEGDDFWDALDISWIDYLDSKK